MKRVHAISILMLVASVAQAEERGLGTTSTKEQITAATMACGTTVTFVDIPPRLRTLVKADFGFNIDPRATDKQRQCVDAKVPRYKVGFISEPLPPSKKK